MINLETKLKLQACLDNELSDSESREIAALIERDPEARALHAELTGVTAVLRSGELEVKLPETREFYWSKIERSIRREEAPRRSRLSMSGYPWLVRIFGPALGAALILTTTLSLVRLAHTPSKLSYLHEIETPLEDTSAMSFHSASAGMTVVWVQSDVY